MDFHSLSRRELQALCKRNKIPANLTNVAMADALKALEIVEGLGEFSLASESETGQSFIDSLEGSEVTSPYVPSTAARSTRRRNATKEELEAVTSMRRTTRKTATKVSAVSQVDTMETPATMVPTSRRKGQMTSVCQKMDSQLKECVEEEKKKDASMTPAPLGATSHRVAEGTTVHRYSTRRSVRLAEKTVQFNDEKSEESELSNNELNLKEGIHMSGIIGVDAIANMEETYENKEKSEVVSAEEQDKAISELEVESTPEEAQMDQELSDNIEFADGNDTVKAVNVCDEVKQSEGCVDVCKSEMETTVENSSKMDIEIDAGSQDVDGDSVGHVLLESEVDEVTHIHNEVQQEHNEVQQEHNEYKEEDVQDLKEEADSYFADEMETLESAKNSPTKQKNVPSTENIPTLDSQVIEPKKDIIKAAKGTDESLKETSLRKLTKMFKEKLEITKKPGDEAAVPRPVLQALPENPLIE